MRTFLYLLIFLVVLAVSASFIYRTSSPPEPLGVAVVELFTSQGCSSCPSADALLSEIIQDAEKNGKPVFALSFHVDYWDHLGWKDPYSSKLFTARQRDYARNLGTPSIYTPQMIVNGSTEFVGSSRSKAHQAIGNAINRPAAVSLTGTVHEGNDGLTLRYSAVGDTLRHNLYVALVESGLKNFVGRGENQGQTLGNDHVVRSFLELKLHASGSVPIPLPAGSNPDNSQVIVFTQNIDTKSIDGATSVAIIRR